MASRLAWLANLKLKQLKSVAIATGVNSSGTKAALNHALQSRLPTSTFSDGSHGVPALSKKEKERAVGTKSIISIDMGIKNLAYCRLIPAPASSTKRPCLTEWKRLDVFNHNDSKESSLDEVSDPSTKDAYHPAVYASAAYGVLFPLIQSDPSAHIVIERQRFRSMGSRDVLEWTLRVNMFEAMLYAVLETLKCEGQWEGRVHDIRPGHVSLYWLGNAPDSSASATGKGQKAKLQKKKDTISLVRGWVGKDGALSTSDTARETVEKYLARLDGSGKLREFGKLDDLADCVAQGMAVLKWEENRRLIWEEGEVALPKVEQR